ncbi:MAG: hypothetical protein V2A77_09350 [Pseudomonadota bacterium]
MGLFDSVFGTGTTTKQSGTTWTKGQQSAEKAFGEWLQPKIGQSATPYGGERIAGLSNMEKSGLAGIKNYGLTPEGSDYGAARTGFLKALDMSYNPVVSTEATQSMIGRLRDQYAENLGETQDTMAHNANLAGMWNSGRHAYNQRQMAADMGGDLLNKEADLIYSDEQARRDEINRNRDRAVLAAEQLQGLGEATDRSTLGKATALMQYGEVPRQLKQSGLDSAYQDWMRTLPENSPWIPVIMGYLGQHGYENSTSTAVATPSVFDSIRMFGGKTL